MLTMSSIIDITNNEARDFKGIGFISCYRLGTESRYRDGLNDNRNGVKTTNSQEFFDKGYEKSSIRIPKANATFFSYHPDL